MSFLKLLKVRMKEGSFFLVEPKKGGVVEPYIFNILAGTSDAYRRHRAFFRGLFRPHPTVYRVTGSFPDNFTAVLAEHVSYLGLTADAPEYSAEYLMNAGICNIRDSFH